MVATRSALIVANDRYQDPGLRRLRAPGQDAEALARVLGDRAIGGFEVRTVTNPPEARLRREIAGFFANRRRDDLLLAHFSCHGVKDDEGQLYFATADTELGNLDSTAVSAEFVNRQMTRSQSRRVVLLLDCCYSGAFARGLLARADTSVDLRDRFEGRGRIVLTASSAMEYAFEDTELSAGRGRPSMFTRALVQGLETGDADRNGDGFVSVDELYDYVYEEVGRAAPKQTPGRWDFEMHGELLLARTPAPRAVPLPSELRQALDHPFSAVRVAAIEELKRLLHGDHAGFALAAAAALQNLVHDDSQRVAAAAAAALASSRVDPPHDAEPPPDPAPSLPAAQPRPAGVRVAEATARPASRRPPTAPAPPSPPAPPSRPRPPEPGGPAAGPPVVRRRARLRPAGVLLVLAVLVLAVAGGLRLLGGSASKVEAGDHFWATSPWRLEVTGRNCTARISSADGGVTNSGHGWHFLLQMRSSGEFTLEELTAGCVAKVAAGPGRLVGLPLTLERDGDGTGGDSQPFRSTGGFRVIADGAGCRTRILRAADGSQVEELYGTARWEHNQSGGFYVHSDPQCRTTVEAI